MLIRVFYYCFYATALCAIIALIGCAHVKTGQSKKKQLPFSAVDSLLNPVYELVEAGRTFRPPVNFEPPSDSIIELIRQTMIRDQGYGQNTALLSCFFDTLHQAGILVTGIEGLNLSADTALFFKNYRNALLGLYGPDNVEYGSGWQESNQINYYSVSDGNIARMQVICLDEENDAIEINYFSPEIYSSKLSDAFKSSVATIESISATGK